MFKYPPLESSFKIGAIADFLFQLRSQIPNNNFADMKPWIFTGAISPILIFIE